ncbi:unnamed protein product [Pieris macdunnoughi]|uniref:Reverse transcriptase domain-containing protein n=1 Tax=Pieris macdunnoughi TaxID=345717 RepID=A0A821U2M4_9NEOP|nr:unnamed protein product [Pieris macdunnoughi]
MRTRASVLAPALTCLFRYLYSRCAGIQLQYIPKKGNRYDSSNYRPIAITSLFSKTNINGQLLRYLEGHLLISDGQYGFSRAHSAGDLPGYLTQRWAEAKGKLMNTRVFQ